MGADVKKDVFYAWKHLFLTGTHRSRNLLHYKPGDPIVKRSTGIAKVSPASELDPDTYGPILLLHITFNEHMSELTRDVSL